MKTLFTMRGVTCVIVQTHQILRLPRKMTVQNLKEILLKTDETSFPMRGRSDHDPDHETVSPQPASQPRFLFTPYHEHFVLKNTTFRAPAIIPNFTEYGACHEKWHFNFTKYCACHEKWHSSLILFTHETLFTISGVRSVIVQNSPNTAPATKNESHDWSLTTNETLFTMRGATCVIVQTHQILRLPRKMTVQNLKEICWKPDETSFPMRGRSDHDPRMIRPSVRNPPRNRGSFSRPPRAFCIEKYNISRSGYHSKFYRILRLPRKVTLQLHQNTAPATKSDTWTSPNTAPATKSDTSTSPNTAPATKSDTWTELWLDWAIAWLSYYLTELWLDWAITWLSYYLTELLLDWAITWLSYDLTELLLDWAITWLSYYLTELLLDWAITWLSYYLTCYDLTELLLDWAMTWLSYYLTELWLDWAITWLSYYLTELWLDWAITWQSYYLTCYDLTELLLDWAITWLSYCLTELWLDWAITWLSYYLTELLLDMSYDLTWAITWHELLLDWAMTWLSYDLTVLLSCDLIRISEVSQLNFLW